MDIKELLSKCVDMAREVKDYPPTEKKYTKEEIIQALSLPVGVEPEEELDPGEALYQAERKFIKSVTQEQSQPVEEAVADGKEYYAIFNWNDTPYIKPLWPSFRLYKNAADIELYGDGGASRDYLLETGSKIRPVRLVFTDNV